MRKKLFWGEVEAPRWRESLGTEPLHRQSQDSAQHITVAVLLTVEGCLF